MSSPGAGPAAGTPVLECAGLRKSYAGRPVVDGVGFEIAAGECYGLLGPNGAGKTTTISMVCGLVERDGGRVIVAGEAIDHRSVSARRHLGLVPQEVALYPDLSALDNLRFFGRLQGLSGEVLEERVADALGAVGLSERAGERVERYSGGMRRRANLAASLLHQPALLVLDEPTVGVDPQSRNSIFELVERLCGAGLAVLYTTHYMEEAERLCHRIGIIDSGRIVAEGTKRELVAQVRGQDLVRIHLGDGAEALAAALGRLGGVERAQPCADGVEIVASEGHHLLRSVLDIADELGVALTGLEVVEPDLEAVFLHLTGKALRD